MTQELKLMTLAPKALKMTNVARMAKHRTDLWFSTVACATSTRLLNTELQREPEAVASLAVQSRRLEALDFQR